MKKINILIFVILSLITSCSFNKYTILNKTLVPLDAKNGGAVLQNFYDDLWSKNDSTIKNISYIIEPDDKYLVINTNGWNLIKDDISKLNLKTFTNEKELKFAFKMLDSYYFELDKDVKEIKEIRLTSATFNPMAMGKNNDNRDLGIDIKSIKILGLYRISNKVLNIQDALANGAVLENFWDNIWLKDFGLIKNISYKISPEDKFIILNTYGWNLIKSDIKKLNLKFFINNKELSFAKQVNNSYYFEIDKTITEITEIKVSSNTFNPKSMGVNNDTRDLGIDLNSIRIAATYKITDKSLVLANAINNGVILENFLDEVWTNGNGIIKNIVFPINNQEDKYLLLTTNGWNVLKDNPSKLNLKMFVNNIELKFNKKILNSFYFNLTDNISEITEIKISSNTFNPKAMGINNDARNLGIDVNSIKLAGVYKMPTKSLILQDAIDKGVMVENFFDNIWTDGNGIIKNLSYQVDPNDNFVVLTTNGWNLIKDDLAKLNLKLYLNNVELKFSKKVDKSFYFEMDKTIKEVTEIKISSTTFNPKSMGVNNDNRNLGMDINTIKFE
ncbi:MAG: hypothetical protein A2Y34_07935 [Spirochaetes bacterium GWC1_27_15]|nr:MAG: hypothetical protein A2Z98_10270 [Spirochaetes bacterium GWB1_27_13]OHD26554.1 MAG: hypothetical protein A2Y34_07935 [Spirochaetes bacterium GWC1_27_15]